MNRPGRGWRLCRAAIVPLAVLLVLVAALRSGAAAVERDPRFGIVHVGYQSAPLAADRHRRAAEIGARWNRWAIYWDQVERQPGQYDWSGVDAALAMDREFGFETNPILLGTPSFHATGRAAASPGGTPRVEDKRAAMAAMRGQPPRTAQNAAISPPAGLYAPVFADGTDRVEVGKPINPNNPWARFVAAAVDRYRGRIGVWELWNEPDFSAFWSGSVADYVRLLKVGHLAARSVDPNATVLVGGMMYWEWTNRERVEHAWLRRFLDELARDPEAAAHGHYFDVIPWHFYSRPSDVYDRIRAADELLRARGVSGKRQWVNESNAPACGEPPLNVACSDPEYRGSATLEEQAAYQIQFLAYALAAGVERAFAFQFQDDGHGESFGLVRNDGSARPAYAAYEVAARFLGGALSATRRTDGNVERIVVELPAGRTTVLWARSRGGETAVVDARSNQATLVDQDGRTTRLYPVDGQYRIGLAGATNNRTFGNDPNDYIIGGPPRLLVEGRTVLPLPTPIPGGTRGVLPYVLHHRAA